MFSYKMARTSHFWGDDDDDLCALDQYAEWLTEATAYR